MWANSTTYSPEVAETIITRVMAGESVARICRDPEMPSRYAFYQWLVKYPELAKQYALAIEVRADDIFDDLFELVDNCEDVNKARLQADIRKWALARMTPKKYGDSMKVEMTVSHEDRLDRIREMINDKQQQLTH